MPTRRATAPAPSAHLIHPGRSNAERNADDAVHTARANLTQWFADVGELITFGRVLAVVQSFDADAVFLYLEKPWKWTPEHARWVELGRPDGADVDVVDGLDPSVDDSDDEGTNLDPACGYDVHAANEAGDGPALIRWCAEPGCCLRRHDGRHVAVGGRSW